MGLRSLNNLALENKLESLKENSKTLQGIPNLEAHNAEESNVMPHAFISTFRRTPVFKFIACLLAFKEPDKNKYDAVYRAIDRLMLDELLGELEEIENRCEKMKEKMKFAWKYGGF